MFCGNMSLQSLLGRKDLSAKLTGVRTVRSVLGSRAVGEINIRLGRAVIAMRPLKMVVKLPAGLEGVVTQSTGQYHLYRVFSFIVIF